MTGTATLTFDLSDPDQAATYRRVNKADDLCSVLWDLAHARDDDPDALCPACKEKLALALADRNIVFEEIWS